MTERRCVVLSVMYNNEATIATMIQSLRPDRDAITQVVLVDNGSTDRSVEVAEHELATTGFSSVVVRSTNTGFAGGYETARRAVAEDGTLLCVNPDVELGAGVLQRLLEAASLPGVGIATAPLQNLEGVEDSASRRRLPTLAGASAYALIGKLLPTALRYNSMRRDDLSSGPTLTDGTTTTLVEATTGALMMLSPEFRTADSTIFDLDYWMYGEDLQLCLDARRQRLSVLMIETIASTHIKGASSGLPRSRHSDRAFHDALFTYYRRNLRRNRSEEAVVRLAIELRFHQSRLRSWAAGRRTRG